MIGCNVGQLKEDSHCGFMSTGFFLLLHSLVSDGICGIADKALQPDQELL